jgi:hypothetical protein
MINKSAKHQNMIPADVIRDLRSGSYEDLVSSIDACLAESKATFVSDNEASVSTIATYPDCAVVATSEGNFFRIKHENVDGVVKIQLLEKFDLPLINKSNATAYVENYALVAVDTLIFGDINASVEAMKGLVSLQESYPVQNAPSLVEQTLQSHIDSAEWRNIFAEHADSIINSVEDASTLEEKKLNPKFISLYDGSLDESKIAEFKELVWADLAILADRLELAHTRVETAHYSFQDMIASSEELSEDLTAEESESLGELVIFADSFIEDVEQIRDLVSESIGNSIDTTSAAQIYDIIAEGMFNLEVTSHFLTDTINKILND